MKKTSYKRKTTTISCDEPSRKFVAAEAERTGRLQREVLAEMISIYQQQKKQSAAKEKEQALRKATALELFQEIKDTLDQNIKHDEQVVSFMKTQESKILSPIAKKLDSCETLLVSIATILKSYKKP